MIPTGHTTNDRTTGGRTPADAYRRAGVALFLVTVTIIGLSIAATGAAVAQDPDPLEPNDGFDDATNVSDGQEYTDLTISDSDDSDYFAITLESGETVTFTTEFSHSQGDLDVTLYDPSRSAVDGAISVTDGETVEHTAQESGTYYLEVYGFDGATNSYSLSASVEEAQQADGADLRSISYGETAQGEIDSADPTGQRGNYEPVTFRGSAGDVVTIEMTSGEGDTYLILQGPNGDELVRNDDGGSGLNSRISTFELPETGEYTIVATSFGSSDTFEYRLSLRQVGEGEVEDGDDLRSISYGETAQGEIDRSDPNEYRGWYEPVTFRGSAGDVVTIEMSSEEGDTFLGLFGPNDDVIGSDDDGGSGVNSRMEVTLPADGEYTIIATSFDSSATFEYDLSLRQEGTTDTDLRSISYGETARGVIDSADPTGQRGNYEPVTFRGSEGDTVTIEMTSETGDTFLILQGPNGDELARDDDGGSGLNSRLSTYTLPETGQYTIVATSYSSSDTFQYELSLDRVSGDGADLRSISYNQTAQGEIDPSDPSGERGFYEPVTFYGSAGDVVTIDMATEDSTATTRDTYLILQGPNGEELARDDDGGNQFNSRIESFVLPETGQYTIVATTYSDDATFEYRLSLDQEGRDTPGGTDLRSISYGEAAQGEIDSADPTGQRGNYEPVTFEGSAGDVVTIEMAAGEGDTYLILQGPNGEELVRDDDGGSGLNSAIRNYRLPADGEYTIVATSFGSSDTFEYDLSLRQVGEGEVEDGDDLRSISYGETAQGEIDRSDPNEYRGWYEPVTFRGSAGDVVTIEMSSEEGDTFLGLFGPNDDVIGSDDDGGSGVNSRMEVTLPEDGEYTIIATSFDSSNTFEYRLSLDQEGRETPGGDNLRSIGYGETARGQIAPGDPAGQRGNYEPVTFQGTEGDVVTIEMSSEEGDTYLILQGPNGEELVRDDDGGSGLNSRIEGFELPETGQYTIVATSFGSAAAFEYELSLDRQGGNADTLSLEATGSQTVDGEYVRVTFQLNNTGDEPQGALLEVGPSLAEVPGDWTIADRTDDGGTWRDSRGVWLFQSIEPGDGSEPSVLLSPPEDATGNYTFAVRAQSNDAIASDTVTVTVRETTVLTAVDRNDNGVIDDGEILDAIEWWRTDQQIPNTDVRISDQQILELTELWQEGESYR